MEQFGVPGGTGPRPVVTLHAVADAAVADHVRWYADQVGDADRLCPLWLDRATHCAATAAEEIVALRALLTRIDTGKWPDTDPSALNKAAAEFKPEYQVVFNYPANSHDPATPAFTEFSPSVLLRSSR
jgi:hypothetical protein